MLLSHCIRTPSYTQMASLISISSLLLFLLLLTTSTTSSSNLLHHHHHRQPPSPKPTLLQIPIQLACNATRFPDSCRAHLPQLPPNSSPTEIIISALSLSSQNLQTATSMVTTILSSSSDNRNRSLASQTCLQLLSLSGLRTSSASSALSSSSNSLKDARAWATAALVYQYDCWSALKYVNDTRGVNETMSFLNDSLIVSTSNALSMLAALVTLGPDTSSWAPPRTERDGFWEYSPGPESELGFGGEFPGGVEADATVCKAGCDYEEVQKAVEEAPSGLEGGRRHVIYVKEGVYDEIVRVGFDKRNLVLVGDGIGRTVITGSLNAGMIGITTYNTATVGVFGDGFMASGLTIQNTAGPDAHQAVAFRSDSDLSFIENCEFLGNQDTLYAHSLRQLYKSCHIQGNVDFIFGNSASLFQNCTILVKPRQLKPNSGETNAVTAHGRTDPAQSTGFAFIGCLVNGTEEYMKLYYSKPSVHKNFLGRPWKEYSRTVFIDSVFEALISPAGWLPWTGDFALKTLYYGEFGNSGPGAELARRVEWSSRIPEEHVGVYSARNFIQADEYSITVAKSNNKKSRKRIGV